MPASLQVIKKIDRIDAVRAAFPGRVRQIIAKGTSDAFARATGTVPVRRVAPKGVKPGNLKNSGSMRVSGDEGEIRYTAYYALYVHEGTFRMAARPWAKDAVESVWPSVLAAFRQLENLV